MNRTVSYLLAGFLASGIATAVYLKSVANDRDAAAPGARFAPETDFQGARALPAPEAFQESREAYEAVAGELNALQLEAEIERLARAETPARRTPRFQALLAQLASLEPWRAVELARQLELNEAELARVFKSWVSVEPAAALAELAILRPSYRRRTVALALVDVFGDDPAGIERIASAFPPAEAMSFRVEVIGQIAERDLLAALAAATAPELTQEARSLAQQRIAVVMARIDPVAAFEQARSIPEPKLRTRYLNRLVDEWAKVDPDSALAYLEDADLPEISLGQPSFHALAASGPERLLVVAEKLSPRTRTNAQEAALAVLAALDPVSAYARVSQLPASGDVNRLIAGIADRFASQNPEAALAWASSLEPRSEAALSSVLSRIAVTNPVRVTDIVIAEIISPAAANSAAMPALIPVLAGPLSAGSAELARVADTLARHDDPRIRLQLDQLLAAWPQTDPEAALDWAMRNTALLSAATANGMGAQIGSRDPARARAALRQLPPGLQGAWLAGAAGGMAATDLNDALGWIGEFRGEPVYERARRAALQAGLDNDAATVATVIDADPETLADLTQPTVAAWARRDPPGAEAWVNSMPPGDRRDQGLAALLQNAISRGAFEAGMLDEFGSDQTRQQALLSSMTQLGQSNPALARELIEEYISDPQMRQRAQAQLEAAAGLPPGVTIVNTIVRP